MGGKSRRKGAGGERILTAQSREELELQRERGADWGAIATADTPTNTDANTPADTLTDGRCGACGRACECLPTCDCGHPHEAHDTYGDGPPDASGVPTITLECSRCGCKGMTVTSRETARSGQAQHT